MGCGGDDGGVVTCGGPGLACEPPAHGALVDADLPGSFGHAALVELPAPFTRAVADQATDLGQLGRRRWMHRDSAPTGVEAGQCGGFGWGFGGGH